MKKKRKLKECWEWNNTLWAAPSNRKFLIKYLPFPPEKKERKNTVIIIINKVGERDGPKPQTTREVQYPWDGPEKKLMKCNSRSPLHQRKEGNGQKTWLWFLSPGNRRWIGRRSNITRLFLGMIFLAGCWGGGKGSWQNGEWTLATGWGVWGY